MNFWFKNKDIVVDCFTADPFTYEYCRVAPASKYLPQWWKTLPVENKNSNMKSCRGFTQLYKNSFILPYWNTLEITVNKNTVKTFNWKTSVDLNVGGELLSIHDSAQYNDFTLGYDYQHIKIKNTWLFKTNSLVEFLWSDPVWNRPDLNNYTVLPGVVDYKYNHANNINIMFEYKPFPYTIIIPAGYPLVMLTPLTEKNIVFKYNLISPDHYNSIDNQYNQPTINKTDNLYNNKKKFITEYEERNKSKCPFGFGSK